MDAQYIITGPETAGSETVSCFTAGDAMSVLYGWFPVASATQAAVPLGLRTLLREDGSINCTHEQVLGITIRRMTPAG